MGTAFVLAAIGGFALSSCTSLSRFPEDCRAVTSTPQLHATQFIRQAGKRKRFSIRTRATFVLYEGGVMRWFDFDGKDSFRCAFLAEDEVAKWLEVARRLASGLEDCRGEKRNVVVVYAEVGGPCVSSAIDDLPPENLEAARELACLVREAFGWRAERVLSEASPRLVELVDFPATCDVDAAPSEEWPKPADR
ncbi:MAG: hypothetical protein D6696_13345 [Acidobacteria bacterium]|nr:MAG: hypothetical protein D6696_13345 [Acidobacteriota bacterium]